MANLYGTANPLAPPAFGQTIGGANVNCPASTETNVIAIATNPPISQGWYYPAVSAVLYVTFGATAPVNLNLGARIGAGADFGSAYYGQPLLVAAATVVAPLQFFGYPTILAYPTGPVSINISLNPTGQPVTCLFVGSYAYAWWQRAPDQ